MLPVLQAERQLLAIEAVSVPHMKDDSRRRVFERYERRAAGRQRMSGAEALATLPIPVRLIPKEVK